VGHVSGFQWIAQVEGCDAAVEVADQCQGQVPDKRRIDGEGQARLISKEFAGKYPGRNINYY